MVFLATSRIGGEDGRVNIWLERRAVALSPTEPEALLVVWLGPESVAGPSNLAFLASSFRRLAARGELELSFRFITRFDGMEDGPVNAWLERWAAGLSLSTLEASFVVG